MLKSITASAFVLMTVSAYAQTTAVPATANPAHAECKQQMEQLCPGIKPGGGRLKACLEQQGKTVKEVCPEMAAAHPHARQGAPVAPGTSFTGSPAQGPAQGQPAPAATPPATGTGGAVPGDTFPSNP